jgi:methanogenic corrinoid protein MtbC1
MNPIIEAVKDAVAKYDEDLLKKLMTQAIDAGLDSLEILNEGLTRALCFTVYL